MGISWTDLTDVQRSALLADPQFLADFEKQMSDQHAREEAERLRALDLTYQSELASVLEDRGCFEEVEISPTSDSVWQTETVDRTPAPSDPVAAIALADLSDSLGSNIHQFYLDLYGLSVVDPSNNPFILVKHEDADFTSQNDFFELLADVERPNSYIYPGLFYVSDDYLSAKQYRMRSITAFCVDIDRKEGPDGNWFSGRWFMNVLLSTLEGRPVLMPTYITLSGTGVHLWYMFGRPLPLLSSRSRRRGRYGRVLKALYRWFDEHLQPNLHKVDMSCCSINHPFRAPHCPTKRGYPTRLFALFGARRPLADPVEIAKFLGCDLTERDTRLWTAEDQASWEVEVAERARKAQSPATDKQLAYLDALHDKGAIGDDAYAKVPSMTRSEASDAIKAARRTGSHGANRGYETVVTNAGHVVTKNGRDPGLYMKALERVLDEVETGTRHNAMFCLAGIAYNCGIPYEKLKEDLVMLKDDEWGRRTEGTHDGKPVQDSDVDGALQGYCVWNALSGRAYSEDSFGFSWGPPAKRNDRSRREHLWGDWTREGVPVVNSARANRELALASERRRTADGKKTKIAEYLSRFPTSSKRQCCEILHMSRSTVTKYWSEACRIAGIEDTRTGNHSPSGCKASKTVE